ncbi:MAG: BrnA antitoxin family protein [Slackia sp.]|nr:BrnA antitoxin family protein [Slackia sp.]
MADMKESAAMPAEVDFSESIPNPYVGRTRRRITINVDGDTVDYFKAEARRTGVPYQTIMNLYLSECAAEEKRLSFV